MIRKYLFYEDINDGYIYFYVDKNEGINAEVFYQYFVGVEVLKIIRLWISDILCLEFGKTQSYKVVENSISGRMDIKFIFF